MPRATRSRRDKVRVWLAPPEWRPADLGGPIEPKPADPKAHPRYAPPVSRAVKVYITAQFVVLAVATMAYQWFQAASSWTVLGAAALIFMATLGAWAGLLERRAWGWPLEGARLVAA